MLKCVIADDEKIVRDDLETLVDWAEEGIELVGLAANGRIAYELFLSARPDIVIADIRMPVIDGIALARMIHDVDRAAAIIFLTGYRDSEYAIQAVNLGVKRYLLKYALTPDALRSVLREVKREIAERGGAPVPAAAPRVEAPVPRAYNRKVAEAIACIRRDHGRDARLSIVAGRIGVSKEYLCSRFRKETGERFTDYVNGVRIEEAKRLLRDTDDKVYEIADTVGYESLQYFSLLFKKRTGLSPMEYRAGSEPKKV